MTLKMFPLGESLWMGTDKELEKVVGGYSSVSLRDIRQPIWGNFRYNNSLFSLGLWVWLGK